MEPTDPGAATESPFGDQPAPFADGALPPPRSRWPLVALLVLLVLLAGGLVPLDLSLHSSVVRADRRQTYLADVAAAARQQAVNFVSFDYRNLAAFQTRLEANSVGQFKTELPVLFADIRLHAVPLKAVSIANVVDVAVISASATQGSALVAVDQIVRNTKNAKVPAGQVQPNRERLRIDLVRVHGHWLTAGLTPIA